MAYVITEQCTKDNKCVEVCPVDCIHPRKDEAGFEEAAQLFISPTDCIDCGACVPVCEASAIFPLDEVPEQSKAAIEKNVQHYA
jgi:ferredoxin